MDENQNQQTLPSAGSVNSPQVGSGQVPPNLPTGSQKPISPVPSAHSTSSEQAGSGQVQVPLTPKISSSIRTMQGDIEAILKGKTPSGVPVKTETQPQPALPPPPLLTPPPAPQPRPPFVKLGETEKAKPLMPPAPPTPLPAFKPPLPLPSKPTLKPTPGINIPPSKKSFLSKQILVVLILVIAVGVGVYWYFVIRPEGPVATPTPLSTKAPPPLAPSLIINSADDPISQINSFINNTAIKPLEIKAFDVIDDQGQTYDMNTFSQKLSLNLDPQFTEALSIDGLGFLLYGQTESFGEIIFEKRFGLIARLDLTFTGTVDEESLLSNFKDIFGLNIDNAQSSNFQENNYKGAKIRYRNFSTADQTIDYAIISILGEPGGTDIVKKYFVITNSRESMYSAIDNINGLVSDLK